MKKAVLCIICLGLMCVVLGCAQTHSDSVDLDTSYEFGTTSKDCNSDGFISNTVSSDISTPSSENTSTNEDSSSKNGYTDTNSKQTDVTSKEETSSEQNSYDNVSQKVYKTPTGKRYHFDPDCGGKNSRETTLDIAKDLGLTPCKKCANG